MTEVAAHGLRFDLAGFSEQGPRSENQDAFSVEAFPEVSLIALADGMGGEKSGRVAADTAIDVLRQLAPIRSVDEARRAVREANAQVVRVATADPDAFGGMGCALGFLALARNGDGPGWIAAHVGDVRILSRSPDGLLRLETRDHTPAFARWEAGEISLDEIPDSAGANRLQRAVGRGGEADVTWLPAAPGWSWLIVSDGIYKAMRLEELAAALSVAPAAAACEAIRRKVIERGPEDNFTAVVVRVLEDSPEAIPAAGMEQTRIGTVSTMSQPSRSPWILSLVLTLLAAGFTGASFWMNRSAEGNAELEQLRIEVDSLRAAVRTLTQPADPFGPSPADSAVPPPISTP